MCGAMIRAERPFQSCVDRRRAFPRAAFPIFLVAALCASGASAAETARSSLFVGATVESSCLVSTQPQRVSRPVMLSCSPAAGGTVAIERGDPGRGTAADSGFRSSTRDADSVRTSGVTRITITY